MRPRTVWDLVEGYASAKGHRPAIVSYDGETRVELSGATLRNWVAKTAGWLQDEAGIRPADRVAILLPPTWPAAVCLLSAWAAGAIPLVPPTGAPGRLDRARAAFVTPELADVVPRQLPALAVGGGFTARPVAETALPAFPDAVLPMPDDLLEPQAAAETPAWEHGNGTTELPGGAQADHAWLLGAAEVVARRHGLGATAVVGLEDLTGSWPLDGLLPALLAGATVVLSHAVADPDAVARAERVTFPSRVLSGGAQAP